MTTDPMTDVDLAAARDERKRKKVAVAKYSLAGVALLGIGAALTSAAWTDSAWFNAQATALDPDDIELEGSLDGATWNPADEGPGIMIESTLLANLVPGDPVTIPLHLKNTGTLPLTVTTPVVTPENGDIPLFATGGATAEVTGEYPLALPVGHDTTVNLVVTLDQNASSETFGGASGSLTVQFEGSVDR